MRAQDINVKNFGKTATVERTSAASSLSRFFIGIRGKEHFLEVLKEDYQVSFEDSFSQVRRAVDA